MAVEITGSVAIAGEGRVCTGVSGVNTCDGEAADEELVLW